MRHATRPEYLGVVLALAVATCSRNPAENPSALSPRVPARYLYIWMGDKDGQSPDFLAVVDVREGSKTFGTVLSTVPVDQKSSMPHHMEYELPPAGQLLFANAHHTEANLLIDFSKAAHPRVVKTIRPPPPLRYPHDFMRLPNGHVLIGYLRSEGPSPVPGDTDMPGNHGGIAEFDENGAFIRMASAAVPGAPQPIRPYAFALRPDVDRMVVTSANMMETNSADVIQIWRMSDFALLHTLNVPPALLPNGKEPVSKDEQGRLKPSGHRIPFEPRVMADGSVLFNAYGCGLYRLTDLATDKPQIVNVYTIDSEQTEELAGCGVPAIMGKYWLMPVGAAHMVVTLDISDPAHPVEVARLKAPGAFFSHWLAKDPGSNRLILGQEMGHEDRVLMLRADPSSGRLSWHEGLRADDGSLGITFVRASWPHGVTGEAIGHAALFRP
jgi:hypothetical protein